MKYAPHIKLDFIENIVKTRADQHKIDIRASKNDI